MPETPVSPAGALIRLRDTELAWDLARLDLETRLRDAFPEEHARVQHAENLVARSKDDLITAIGAYGPLKAEDKAPIGWAHYSSATRREYAPVASWKAALTAAGLGALLPAIIVESINGAAVEELVKTSGDFHRMAESLITTRPSKPSLRYHWNPPEKEQP